MCRLVILVFINFIIFSSAKVALQDMQDNELGDVSESSKLNSNIALNPEYYKDMLWVMDINDEVLDDLKLREPTVKDEEEFFAYCGPLIEKHKSLNMKTARKAALSTANDTSETEPITREDIFKYLNKFALFSKTDSDTYLTDSNEQVEPSITINFKGQYTALIVKMGMSEWHYFYLVPPFPSWFYKEHTVMDQDDFVQVPEDVKKKFYTSLYLLLQKAMNYLV